LHGANNHKQIINPFSYRDMVQSKKGYTGINPGGCEKEMDLDDAYDILVQNGMFRNRDPEHLAKPISGSNIDMADVPGEISDYEKGIQAWIDGDQESSLKEAFPEEW
jgi:hypothetical protein